MPWSVNSTAFTVGRVQQRSFMKVRLEVSVAVKKLHGPIVCCKPSTLQSAPHVWYEGVRAASFFSPVPTSLPFLYEVELNAFGSFTVAATSSEVHPYQLPMSQLVEVYGVQVLQLQI